MRTLKENDNVRTRKIIPIIKNFMESVCTPIEEFHQSIEEFEWLSRSGFSAHDHNRGGMDLIAIADYRTILGSGIGDKEVMKLARNEEKNAIEYIKKDHPDLEENSDRWFEILDDYLSDDYSQVAFRVRAMYEGDGLLMVYIGYDTDAPYFRWNDKPSKKYKVRFKTNSELKRKLQKILKKI